MTTQMLLQFGSSVWVWNPRLKCGAFTSVRLMVGVIWSNPSVCRVRLVFAICTDSCAYGPYLMNHVIVAMETLSL